MVTEIYASEAYDKYLDGYVETATVCGALITEFIFNVISEILLYNNFNNRFLTVKECVSQRRNIDDFLCDTYYEEEDDE